MLCPDCKGEDNRVLHTRQKKVDERGEAVPGGLIERVRYCKICGFSWVTQERKRKTFRPGGSG